ncbi:hypothetical protein [Agrobacterium vitis]|uniref:hypothetical protein n=1 Tax=Agrobacterium vitis TaxID=373 RepID=UPI0015728507|nr:hypothetical protein [Agrobacterium vitis]NSZ17329.1 hypothetical protein [Agrobacterium vitis]QZO03038.1 hypothetical protein K4831_11330 [Agrobacterium vitis]UJL88160.1 hypothetical protein AVF2S5_09670 [Agrobacterium vitis]
MTNRIFIGQNGNSYQIRVSKAGYDVTTVTDPTQLAFYETLSGLVPFEQGLVTVASGATVSVTLTGTYTYYPFIVLRNNLNQLPGNWYYARLTLSSKTLTFKNNYSASMVIKYCVFRELDW